MRCKCTTYSKEHKQQLKKRAKANYISKAMAGELSKIKNTPLHQAYVNTLHCNETLLDKNGKLTTHWCKNRWCLVCNRNRTGKLINEYTPRLDKYNDWYFVTLTVKTVKGEDLSTRIDAILDAWRKISENARVQKKSLMGIRKLECTVRPFGMYHPHLHFLIRGKEMAEWAKNQWLKHWMYEARPRAQHIREADKNSRLELFKYFTKLIVKDIPADMFNPKPKRILMHPEKMDVIFRAMRGRRVYASFGKMPRPEEEVTEVATIPSPYEGCVFKWVNSDWFDTRTGEALTGWVPNKDIEELVSSISSPPTEDEEFDEEPVSSISPPPPEIEIKPPDELTEVF